MIHIKSIEEMEEYRSTAGTISKSALRRAGAMCKPGVSTQEIDRVVESFIRLHGATPGFKGIDGFPASICASVNEQIVHGIPSPDTILKEGDIISIDTGANKMGWAGDNAWTFYVGEVSSEVKGLCEITRDCLKAGIREAVPGNHVGDIGFAVQDLAERNGYGVVREYVGHGVGHKMHEDPRRT
jgi:methionyl aminopeptidase